VVHWDLVIGIGICLRFVAFVAGLDCKPDQPEVLHLVLDRISGKARRRYLVFVEGHLPSELCEAAGEAKETASKSQI
jgi:hypothetical protein